MTKWLVLSLAQGFFVGRIPVTPGTFGSLLGLVWVAVLLSTGNALTFSIGTLLGIALSVWVCDRAEKLLGQTDPGSVVLDEIVALPVCFASWIWTWELRRGQWPGPEALFQSSGWVWTAGIFAAFRFFDIIKPWPVRQSQHLAGGWGVTVDDLLAAAYVNLAFLAIWAAVSRLP